MTGSTDTGTDLDELSTAVSGPVYRQGEAKTSAETAGLNTAAERAPIAVVRARDVHDVAAAVRWAGRRGIAVGVHATGHGARSYRDAVVVGTRGLNTCRIDPQRRIATVDAGVRWATVIRAAAEHGLAPLNGSSATVGVVGYTLGGGIGPLARQYGFAADHVRSLDLVAADGTAVHVTPTSRPDLYWAALGAPGSFGVVTRLEFDLMPIRRVYSGALHFATLRRRPGARRTPRVPCVDHRPARRRHRLHRAAE
jgi:FAD/FMN-containing dehydrogenase